MEQVKTFLRNLFGKISEYSTNGPQATTFDLQPSTNEYLPFFERIIETIAGFFLDIRVYLINARSEPIINTRINISKFKDLLASFFTSVYRIFQSRTIHIGFVILIVCFCLILYYYLTFETRKISKQLTYLVFIILFIKISIIMYLSGSICVSSYNGLIMGFSPGFISITVIYNVRILLLELFALYYLSDILFSGNELKDTFISDFYENFKQIFHCVVIATLFANLALPGYNLSVITLAIISLYLIIVIFLPIHLYYLYIGLKKIMKIGKKDNIAENSVIKKPYIKDNSQKIADDYVCEFIDQNIGNIKAKSGFQKLNGNIIYIDGDQNTDDSIEIRIEDSSQNISSHDLINEENDPKSISINEAQRENNLENGSNNDESYKNINSN